MRRVLINRYLAKIDDLRLGSGRSNEQVIRPAFRRLLEDWATDQKLKFIEEYPYDTSLKSRDRAAVKRGRSRTSVKSKLKRLCNPLISWSRGKRPSSDAPGCPRGQGLSPAAGR